MSSTQPNYMDVYFSVLINGWTEFAIFHGDPHLWPKFGLTFTCGIPGGGHRYPGQWRHYITEVASGAVGNLSTASLSPARSTCWLHPRLIVPTIRRAHTAVCQSPRRKHHFETSGLSASRRSHSSCQRSFA